MKTNLLDAFGIQGSKAQLFAPLLGDPQDDSFWLRGGNAALEWPPATVRDGSTDFGFLNGPGSGRSSSAHTLTVLHDLSSGTIPH